jgi:hypothetical protein
MRAQIVGLVGACAVAALVTSRDASATWFRLHSSACFLANPFGDTAYGGQDSDFTAFGSPELMCSAPDSSNLPRVQFRTVRRNQHP